MFEQVEKPKEGNTSDYGRKSRAAAISVTRKKNNVKQDFGFVDNRPESIRTSQLKGMIRDHDAIQLETKMSSRQNVDLKDEGTDEGIAKKG